MSDISRKALVMSSNKVCLWRPLGKCGPNAWALALSAVIVVLSDYIELYI